MILKQAFVLMQFIWYSNMRVMRVMFHFILIYDIISISITKDDNDISDFTE